MLYNEGGGTQNARVKLLTNPNQAGIVELSPKMFQKSSLYYFLSTLYSYSLALFVFFFYYFDAFFSVPL